MTHVQGGISPQSCTETDFEMKTSNFVFFYSFQSFQSIFGLYMMKQYIVKLRTLFPQFYTGFLVLMSHPDNGGFLKIAQKRDSISKKTSFCIMVINSDHQES